MTYNVFSGTLNPTHFTSLHCCCYCCYCIDINFINFVIQFCFFFSYCYSYCTFSVRDTINIHHIYLEAEEIENSNIFYIYVQFANIRKS